ncbi:pyocin knob domain-containing protein [Paenibacillus sp. B2(2019)]|uniref:pyocin knob domain-containing protein n=1 Tax=Paenibacillus sp. B2(2019) TaxID=2607754 RepID=UPI0011F1A1AD|nr:pyocin knob domain-containing protein [Paenibacillus sp. B2(2019)]KAA1180926.1 hypothetical protein PAENI_27215 [Paenibacillus sp. B2(2019)]
MAYNKQQWKDEIPDLTKPIRDSSGKQKTDPQTGRPLYELVQEGTRLTAQRLNHIEDGIETVHELADQNAADIDTHKKDTVKHITAAERAEWKAKETPAGAQTKADAALSSAKTYADTALLAKADKSSTYSKTETDQRIQAVVGAAPDALDTLKEIGDALNNDPNFAATVTNQLSGKVDKVSGKQLSTEDYSSAEKAKLAGLTPGAGAAGSATDATIGNRTADPSITTPYSLTGSITQWFSWITKYFKAITGKANPFDAPDITLAATKTHVDNTVVHVTSAERTAWNAAETNAKNASIPKTDKGAANGVAGLDANVKVPDAQIPSNIARKAVEIPASADLNTYTSEGEYYQGTSSIAATITNKPASSAFHLRVSRHNGVNQWFTTFGIPGTGEMFIYTRNVYQGAWGPWEEVETTRKKNIASGYGGLDANAKLPRVNTYNSLGGTTTTVFNMDTLYTAGVHAIGSSATGAPETGYGQAVVHVSSGEVHDGVGNWIWQMWFGVTGGTWVRQKVNNGIWQPWAKWWTGKNDAELLVTRSAIANNTDFNTLTTNGVYAMSQATGLLNPPPNISFGVLIISRTDGGSPFVKQEVTDVLTGNTKTRFRNGSNVWTPWVSNITSGGIGVMEAMLTRRYAGTSYKYSDLASYGLGGATTGTMKITLPVGWTQAMMRIKISGYEYVTGKGAWELLLGGYNFTTGWAQTTANIIGNPPFNSVRFAYDGSKCCILLGGVGTAWNFPQIEVSEVLAGHTGASGLGGTWSVEPITTETGITNVLNTTLSYGNANTLNGYAPSQTATPNTIPIRNSVGEIEGVSGNVAKKENMLVPIASSNLEVLSYTPTVDGAYTASVYLSLQGANTTKIVLTYGDMNRGMQTLEICPSTTLAIDCYTYVPAFIMAKAGTPISIKITISGGGFPVNITAALRKE